MSEAYFFDSYAIIEILAGSKNYKKYAGANIISTQLNLFEVYYKLLAQDRIYARRFIKQYERYAVPYTSDTICVAADVKKGNLSMTDCIGYALALEYGIKFLTGDQEFKDMKNVEYVK